MGDCRGHSPSPRWYVPCGIRVDLGARVLQLLDESLEAFLRATVPLDPTDVAISFEAPDKAWAATVTQPTINLFLWDIHRATDKARAGMETVNVNGQTARSYAASNGHAEVLTALDRPAKSG